MASLARDGQADLPRLHLSDEPRVMRARQVQAAERISQGVTGLLTAIARMPGSLSSRNRELGELVGQRLASKFRNWFMTLSPEEKGHGLAPSTCPRRGCAPSAAGFRTGPKA